MRWPGFVTDIGERRGTCSVLVGELWVERPLETPVHMWKDNINTDLQEIEWGSWTGLVWCWRGVNCDN
jgi:hypothetical protein